MFFHHSRTQHSFTLIELLVVIAVIGLLSAIVAVSVKDAREKAKIAKLQVYSDSVRAQLSDDLISFWSFDEGTGTTTQDVWSNNKGTLGNGSCTPGNGSCPSWLAGISGQALSFGGDDYVDAGNNISLLPDTFTVAAWVKTPGNGYLPLVSWAGATPAVYVRYAYLDSTRALIYLGGTSYRYFDQSPVNVLDDNWHYVVFVVTGNGQADITNSKLYVDGQKQTVSATSSSGGPSSKTNFYIGRAGSSYFNGLIDDPRLYNRALTAQQIKDNYYAGLRKLLAQGRITEKEYQELVKSL